MTELKSKARDLLLGGFFLLFFSARDLDFARKSGPPRSENSRLLPSPQDLEVAAEFSITNGLTSLLEALKKRNYVKV